MIWCTTFLQNTEKFLKYANNTQNIYSFHHYAIWHYANIFVILYTLYINSSNRYLIKLKRITLQGWFFDLKRSVFWPFKVNFLSMHSQRVESACSACWECTLKKTTFQCLLDTYQKVFSIDGKFLKIHSNIHSFFCVAMNIWTLCVFLPYKVDIPQNGPQINFVKLSMEFNSTNRDRLYNLILFVK